MRGSDNEELWERHAGWWQREFTAGADPEYEDLILPLIARHLRGARRVLDVGCGEGQVARHLAGLGIDVFGVDPTTAEIVAAHACAGGPRYGEARADALPCRDRAFDAALLCLALEHVDDFETAIAEVARTLEPGGRFVLLLCHPLLQAPGGAWIDDPAVGEHYWRVSSYLQDHAIVDEVAPGVALRFLHRPLGRYVHALGAAGLLVEDMEEPPPPPRLVEAAWGFAEAHTIPRVLLIRARRGVSPRRPRPPGTPAPRAPRR